MVLPMLTEFRLLKLRSGNTEFTNSEYKIRGVTSTGGERIKLRGNGRNGMGSQRLTEVNKKNEWKGEKAMPNLKLRYLMVALT